MNHLTNQHWVLLLPVVALCATPLFPMNSQGQLVFGIPVIIVWVAAWAIVTTLILSWLYRHEPELGESPAAGTNTEAAS